MNLERIDKVLSRAKSLLNTKEESFLNSIRGQVIVKDRLSPGQNSWLSALENKFAKRILSEYESPCKFKKGDCIQIRKNNRLDLANYDDETGKPGPSYIAYSEKVGFVVATNSRPITRAAKGSKIYKILLVGEVSPIYAHESDLKTKRGKKI